MYKTENDINTWALYCQLYVYLKLTIGSRSINSTARTGYTLAA